MRDYVRKRASGAEKSKLDGDTDLLTLMMTSPETFSEEFIIDELIDFLAAGTQTTQNAAQTILSHFALDHGSVKRVREEYDSVIGSAGIQSFNSLTFESAQDLTYMSQVINEALRYNPPAPSNSFYCLSKDTKIAGKLIKTDSVFVVNIYRLHRNKS